MAITIADSSVSSGTNAATSFDIASITVAAGERLLVAVGMNGTAEAVTGVTWNGGGGEALSLIAQPTAGSGGTSCRCTTYEIVAPTAGTGTVTVATDASGTKCGIALAFAGTAVGAGWRDASANHSATATTTPSLTITSAADDVPLLVLCQRNTTATTFDFTADASPVSELFRVQTGAGSSHCRLLVLTETGAASTSPSGVCASSTGFAGTGFNINIASAGVTIPLFMNQYRQRWK